jgi:hypothetical protein
VLLQQQQRRQQQQQQQQRQEAKVTVSRIITLKIGIKNGIKTRRIQVLAGSLGVEWTCWRGEGEGEGEGEGWWVVVVVMSMRFVE